MEAVRRYIENQGTNPSMWEQLESKRGADIERFLYALPAFTNTFMREYENRDGDVERVYLRDMPWVWLACPKGHPILPAELSVDHNWHLSLSPRETHQTVAKSAQVVRRAIWEVRQSKLVCAEPGCPTIGTTFYCQDHDPHPDTTVENELQSSRVTIDCESCSFTGTYKLSRLLVAFAHSVVAKKRTMRLDSSARRSRR